MGIYAGVDGVVRNIPYVDVSPNGAVRHAPEGYVGVDGALRKFRNALDDIDYIKLSYISCEASNCNSSGPYGDLGRTVSICSQYASISIGSNYASVKTTAAGKWVGIRGGSMDVVFKDGHQADLRNMVNSGLKLPVSISVSYYMSAYGGGRYVNNVQGVPVYSGSFYNSTSGTTTVNVANHEASYIASALTSGSYFSVQQTFNSIALGGRSFPVRVVNNLP